MWRKLRVDLANADCILDSVVHPGVARNLVRKCEQHPESVEPASSASVPVCRATGFLSTKNRIHQAHRPAHRTSAQAHEGDECRHQRPPSQDRSVLKRYHCESDADDPAKQVHNDGGASKKCHDCYLILLRLRRGRRTSQGRLRPDYRGQRLIRAVLVATPAAHTDRANHLAVHDNRQSA